MSFNGSGTFLINSTGQPVVANTVISATVFNALTADLASGLTNCITKDGQSTPTANIPMGSNKITGLANGTLTSDAATLGQVQTTAAKLIGSISGVDTITGVMSPTLPAYAAGQLFYFVAGGANTGAVTLNIDSLGAKAVTRDGSTALAAGDINSGEMVVVIYDGTRFQMINAANSFGNTTINGTLTVTGKSNLAEVSSPSINASVAVINALTATGASIASANAATAVVTNLTATNASVASVNAGVALLTTATVTSLTATGASIASANIGNLQFTAASIASINAGVAVVTNLTATGASIASANVGTAVITTGTVTSFTATSASVASANAGTAVITNGTVTNLTSTSASIASANAAVALITTGTVTNLTSTAASVASANIGTAVITGLTATGASIASANAGNLQVTGASVASANLGTAVITTGTVTNLTSTSASVASANLGVALVTTGTVTNLTSTAASIASANLGTAVITTLTAVQASIGSANLVTARFLGSSSGYVGVQAAAAAGSATYTLPSADGSNGQVLSTNGTGTLSWESVAGTGDVVGPASSTDNAIARFDSTTGKLLQNSTVILDDAGSITGVAILAATTVNATNVEVTNVKANDGTAAITISDSSGNVGIGTTPGMKLDVNGISGWQGGTTGQTAQIVGANSSFGSGGNLKVLSNTTQAADVGGALTLGGYYNGTSLSVDFAEISGRKENSTSNNTAGYFAVGTRPNGGNMTERLRIDSEGRVGIGGTPSALAKLHVLGALPSSGNSSVMMRVTAEIPSQSTTNTLVFQSNPTTEASSFTLTTLSHFYASQQTFGAGSTVSNQYGFNAHSALTGATNNYGFYSNIASGSGRFNFYAAGTADNYFAGNVGIGTTNLGTAGLSLSQNFNLSWEQSSTESFVNMFRQTSSAATVVSNGYKRSATANGFASSYGSSWAKTALGLGVASGAITFYTDSAATASVGTDVTPTERMRIDSSGNVGIGGTAAANTRLDIVGTLPTSSNVSVGIRSFGTIPSGTTNTWLGFGTGAATEAASFTISQAVHYRATQGTLGAGSAITSQYGFQVLSTLTGATNNYGFWSDIASGSNRWNFYANGTAQNHFNGRVLIGKTDTSISVAGCRFENDGCQITRATGDVLAINRQNDDGKLVAFYQGSTEEGDISVSGTAVSYNGGHLARWSQTVDNTRIELLKGTVMSNLDQMAKWIDPETGQPQQNDQLNCMKVSDVEGDVNVAGVFVNWDNDDSVFTADMNIAMTGDMIIRIAQGVTVQRGDLLMSAGDGTAKPQGDDVIRSKTIAKVTSNHVTCTYDDGSYCVPCVLMAC